MDENIIDIAKHVELKKLQEKLQEKEVHGHDPIVAKARFAMLSTPQVQSQAANHCATVMGQALLNSFVKTERTKHEDTQENEIRMVFDLHTQLYNLERYVKKQADHYQMIIAIEKKHYAELQDYWSSIFDFIRATYSGDGNQEIAANYEAFKKEMDSKQ